MNSQLFFFYGSLRPTMYNYSRFFNSNNHKILADSVTIHGFEMHSLGAYPAVIKSSVDKHIVGTIIEIEDQQIIRSIHLMEIGAGYTGGIVKINDLDVNIYFMKNKDGVFNERTLVKGGNWINHLKVK